ncbi:unnamed protein product [Schistosoma margrebowiei]|uniref:Uncharacterized protein n=1 Tax=Schistosoma margrebowiei TaxID=48269 RepID=A0A183LGL8_9TREM|nr:unnamed protein product [Schistosoma margrebowiei]
MRTSTSHRKHGTQRTTRNQLDDSDFADDLALLFHTPQQMQVKTTSVAAASISVGLHTQGKNLDPQMQHRIHRPYIT